MWEKDGFSGPTTGSLTKISSTGNEIPASYSGIWSGNGTQDNPPGQWTILIGLNNGAIGSVVGTVAYPSLECGGKLTLQSVNPDSIEFFEDITYGTNCVDEGTVTLNLVSANELGFAWEKDGFPGTATGSLTRISQVNCTVPFFSQRDDNWANHPLRTNGACSPECGTIGTCGCTLTSATMLFAYYGASLIPPSLSDCMGTSACPFNWSVGASCTNGKATSPIHYNFSYRRLDNELNQNNRPVILGMYKNGNPQDTHWVLVTSGQGNDPANYVMHDPWPEDGANLPLSIRAIDNYVFNRIVVYSGQPECTNLSILSPYNQVTEAVPVVFEEQPSSQNSHAETFDTSNMVLSSEVTGTVRLYRMTEVTMTLRLTATSTLGEVTEMQVWTDANPNPVWQPFANFVWLPWFPEYDTMYVRFRDEFGNTSDITTDTIHPVYSPPPEPELKEVFLPIILRTP